LEVGAVQQLDSFGQTKYRVAYFGKAVC